MADVQLTEQELDQLMERIQKMIRLRDNPGATVGEVANATTMIQELLLKYNLSMSEIEQHTPQQKLEDEYQKSDRFDLGASSNYRTEWRVSLLNVIARNHFCRMAYFSRTKAQKRYNYEKREYETVEGKDASAVLIGKPYNVQVTKELYEWIAWQLNRLCTQAWTAYQKEQRGQALRFAEILGDFDNRSNFGKGDSKKAFKTSFFDAAVNEIHARLVQARREQEEKYANAHALIVVSDEALAKAYDHYFPKVKDSYHWFEPGPRGRSKLCAHKDENGAECGKEKSHWHHYRRSGGGRRSYSESGREAGIQAGRSVSLTPTKKVSSRSSRKELN